MFREITLTIKQDDLALFFQNHLYPLTSWYKGNSGLYYSSNKIKVFKGLKLENKYNYAVYHKAANLYIEHFNSEKVFELTSNKEINQFQLTQPVVAGRRFFSYTLYYWKLYEEVYTRIEDEFENDIVKDTNGGNGYIRNLFINVVMFYVDRFDIDSLSKTVLNKLYKWAYSLRLMMHSVYQETANNYALGFNDKVNYGLNIFNRISEMSSPSDMDSIILGNIELNKTVTKRNTDTTTYKYQELWNERKRDFVS